MNAIIARACENCGALYVERLNSGICNCGGRVIPLGEINPDLKAIPSPRVPWWKRWMPVVQTV